MGEEILLDCYWVDRYELAQHEEPLYDCVARPDPEDWDDEDGFPCSATDLSDDADALASAGWSTDEDYGGYWDE